MRQDPLVSVVMGSFEPCWSRLRRAVDSLVGQTLPEWELLLWDDGSSPQGALALEQAARLEDIFVACSRYEALFWDMAWAGEE